MYRARFMTILVLVAVGAGLAVPSDGTGQTPAGRVKGGVTDTHGAPLPGVNVYLETTQLGAATDSYGRFAIEAVPEGSYILIASAVGFQSHREPIRVSAGVDSTYLIALSETSVLSSEVIVSASRQARLSSSVPASFSLITPRDLAVRNIVSLDQALRYVSGVQVMDNQVNIRGSSGFSFNAGSRVLVLLDGLPLLSPESDGIPFDALPFAQVERIEIIKGPGSALFGGGALGGVINVITRDYPRTPAYHFKAYSGVHEPVTHTIWKQKWEGGDDWRPLWGMTFSHARRMGSGAGFWLNVDYRKDDGYTYLSKRRIFQGFGKVGWSMGDGTKMDVLLSALSRRKDTFLFWNGITDALNPGEFALGDPLDPTGSADALTTEFVVQPAIRHVLGSKLLLQSRLRVYGIVIQAIDTEGNAKPVSDGTLGFRYGGEVQLDWSPALHRSLVFGVSADANTTESTFFTTGDGDDTGSQPEAALFVQWQEQPTDKIEIVGGLRFDTYRIDGSESVEKLSPKIAASYRAADPLVLRASYGQGFRVPGLAERFVNNQDRFPLFPNPDLLPEESSSYEIGFRLLGASHGSSFRLDVAGFWNDYKDLIEPKLVRIAEPDAAPKLGFQFVNLTQARIRGAEIGLDASVFDDRVSLKVGYTFLDSEDLDTGAELPFRPDHLFTAGVDARVWSMFEAGADFRFAARPNRVDTDFIRFVPDADVLVETRVSDFWIAVNEGRARLAIHANNAFDYYYLERPAFLAAPRHYVLQLTVDL